MIICIGRGPDNSVVLDYPMISWHHAQISVSDEEIQIEDLGSSNGTAIGNPANKIDKARLAKDDIVYFGSLRIPAARLLDGHVALGQLPHETVHLGGRTMVAGRDPACDIVLNDPTVSWRHAYLVRSGSDTFLEDLGSSNGTFVNGRRISGRVLLRAGAVVSLGTFSFTVRDDGKLHKRDLRGNVTLEARGVSADIPGMRVLQRVSLVVHPGELVGVMGASGSGKTTLLSVLNGYVSASEGQVLLNGQKLHDCYRQFALLIGYVPQDDIIHRDLTVFQALYYSARLRLASDTTDHEIEMRIWATLKQLNLEGIETALIGSPEKRGISGGQRKRVNLAMELLTDPVVLFLDEPTSGLSSHDAEVVMRVLRALADNGKTVVITLHQPGLEVFRLLDNLLMLAKDPGMEEPGRLAYYGPAFPDGLAFFVGPETNRSTTPENMFQAMGQRCAKEWEAIYRRSGYHRDYFTKRVRPDTEVSFQETAPKRPGNSFLYQWLLLVRRAFAIKSKDRLNSAILLLQAPVVGMLIVLVFGKQLSEQVSSLDTWVQTFRALGTALFLMALAAIWFGASNAVREIVGERAIYRRERMVNLSILAYVGSKFTVLGTLAVVQCITLLIITFFGCNLQSSPVVLFLLLLLAAFIGITIGLVFSALARSSEMAIALLPVALLAMVIVGGVMQPIHKMHPTARYLSVFNAARWCFEGMILLESEQRPLEPQLRPSDTKDMAEHYFPRQTDRSSVKADFAAMLLLFAGCAAASPLILRFREL